MMIYYWMSYLGYTSIEKTTHNLLTTVQTTLEIKLYILNKFNSSN